MPLLFVGWTLIFEMFFYYLLTLNLLFGAQRIVERTMFTILVLVGFGTVIGFQRPVMILFVNPLNLEFLFGCLIGTICTRVGRRQTLGNLLLAVGSLLLLSTLFWANFSTGIAADTVDGNLSWYRVFVWGIPAAILTAGVALSSPQIRSAPGRLGVRLGDSSYSIYLVSGIVFYLYNMEFRWVKDLGSDANVGLSMLLVVLIGWLCYEFIEAPMTRWITAKYHHPAVQSAP